MSWLMPSVTMIFAIFEHWYTKQMVDKTLCHNAVQLAIAKETTVTEAMWLSNQFE